MTTGIETANQLLGEGYMTDTQTVAFLGISSRTMYRKYLERTGPPRIEVGRKIFYTSFDDAAVSSSGFSCALVVPERWNGKSRSLSS